MTPALAIAALATVVPMAAAPADAPAEELENTITASWTEGEQWQAPLTGELFDDIELVVPGDSMSQTLYVKVDGPEPGTLRVWVDGVAVSGDQAAVEYTDEEYTINGTAVADYLGTETDLLVQDVQPGDIVPVDLAYDFPMGELDNDANKAFGPEGDVLLEVWASIEGDYPHDPADPVEPEPQAGAGEGGGRLEDTGAPVAGLIAASALLAGAGAILSRSRRSGADPAS